ncbi:hypothetical protein DUNSADRAFT_7520 [Dunaliella salina]|uniref:Uncharacterized protein n=1 Tax=Dunaliella salina TaxID=3046 RepID=A0ABQ7GL67_DUNSA|nr:hypothetical protein DUNSADRAFT_7520 [Dunaliella salina]|eukprot:KAF5835354.1 hypothetical protein DUNSADRAFT_7520 [Dunaliella salina]
MTHPLQLRNAWPRDFAAIIVERCTRDRKPGHPHRLSQLSPDRLALLAWSAGRLLGVEPPLLGTPTPASTSSDVNAGRDTSSSAPSGSGSPDSGSTQQQHESEVPSSVAQGHDLAGMARVLSNWGTNWGKDAKKTKRGFKQLTWSTKRLEHTSTEQLGILAYGLALLEPRASAEGVQRIVEAAVERTQQVVFSGFTRADCVRLATACAATGVRHPALFASLAAAALLSLKHWPAQDAGAMAASFGAARIKHEVHRHAPPCPLASLAAAAAALPSLKYLAAQDAGIMAASFGAARIKHDVCARVLKVCLSLCVPRRAQPRACATSPALHPLLLLLCHP